MTTRRRQQPLNTEPHRASRIAAKVADEIQSATWEWISPRLFYTFNFLTLRVGSPRHLCERLPARFRDTHARNIGLSTASDPALALRGRETDLDQFDQHIDREAMCP